MAAATWNMTVSPSAGARTWTPMGRPSAPVPKGTVMAGWPARLDGMVHRSDRYIANGSAALAPMAKAVVGVVADSSTSKDAYAASKSLMMSVRTRWAWA